MARKTRLTKEITQQVFNGIAAGNTQEIAANLAGISESTFYYWKKKGETAKSGQFRNFYDEMKRAEALAEAKRVEIIRKAAEGKGQFEDKADWKAAAWYLERRYPEKYGRRVISADLNHTGEVTQRHEYENTAEIITKLQQDQEGQELLEQLFERARETK